MMNTLQIQNLLEKNKTTVKLFKGVYPYNKIPKKLYKKPFFIIVNLDPNTKPGTHWFCIFCPKFGCIEVFDSYGDQAVKTNIKAIIRKNSKKNECFIKNIKRLQGDYSDVCGYYCCVFAYYRCKNYSMKNFLDMFNNRNYNKNDEIIVNKFKNIFL